MNSWKVVSASLVVAYTLSVGHAFATQGGVGSTGGGFGYSRSAAKKLRDCARILEADLRGLDLSPYLLRERPAASDKLADVVAGLKMNFTGNVVRKNPEGDEEPLFLNYGKDPATGRHYIEALQPMFTFLMGTGIEVKEIKRMLVHEALHTAGYDEEAAFKASTAIAEEIERRRAETAKSYFGYFGRVTNAKSRAERDRAWDEWHATFPKGVQTCIGNQL